MAQLIERLPLNRHNFRYFSSPVKAAGHPPIYKMHKYFARRPHNVFRALIEFYSRPGDVILDCFCGGGVSVVEGLSIGRKTIGCDVNPISSFVTASQLLDVDISEYSTAMDRITQELQERVGRWYFTRCRECSSSSPIRWCESAFIVICPACRKRTSLANSNKLKRNGEDVNGYYVCQTCAKSFPSADTKRIDVELLTIRYRCPRCKKQRSDPALPADQRLFRGISTSFESEITRNRLWFPTTEIPSYWDRQREDCLHRKGFSHFCDLFTKRNLLSMAHYLKILHRRKYRVPDHLYNALLFTFSATLRYTNSLTFSTDSWMGGRPIAWAKHAFWVPNQFVEVNPFEYIDKRVKAVVSGIKWRKKIIPISKQVTSYAALTENSGNHIVWNRSSESLPLPNESISLVITDPPYGSNVQYGELTSFWTVWLAKDLLIKKDFLSNDKEIVVHRKISPRVKYRKTFNDYYLGLFRVFKECYRVLKPDAPFVFTFNNKELPAWFAVLKAAINAGFHLDPAGIIFQESIEIYKDTSHLRYAGALQGDFIYTFLKTPTVPKRSIPVSHVGSTNIRNAILDAASILGNKKKQFSTNDLYVAALRRMIPLIAAATADITLDDAVERFGSLSIEETVLASGHFQYHQGIWNKK